MKKYLSVIAFILGVAMGLVILSAMPKAEAAGTDIRPCTQGVWVVGDSMSVLATPYLKKPYPSWEIDAKWGRGVTQLPVRIDEYNRTHDCDPKVAVFALGTNREPGWKRSDYRASIRKFTKYTKIVFVNIYRPAAPENGAQYSGWMKYFADSRPETELADWRGAAMADPTLISEDQTHQSEPKGQVAWANLVIAAVRRVNN